MRGYSRAAGVRRNAILAVLSGAGRALTAEDVFRGVRSAGVVRIGRATVYRNLGRMVEEGMVMARWDGDGVRRFRRAPAGGHRHHALCERCGRAQPVDAAEVIEFLAGFAHAHGFGDLEFRIGVQGVCAGCSGESGAASEAPPPA